MGKSSDTVKIKGNLAVYNNNKSVDGENELSNVYLRRDCKLELCDTLNTNESSYKDIVPTSIPSTGRISIKMEYYFNYNKDPDKAVINYKNYNSEGDLDTFFASDESLGVKLDGNDVILV